MSLRKRINEKCKDWCWTNPDCYAVSTQMNKYGETVCYYYSDKIKDKKHFLKDSEVTLCDIESCALHNVRPKTRYPIPDSVRSHYEHKTDGSQGSGAL